MNKAILLIGCVACCIFAAVFNSDPAHAAALVLLWMGLATGA